MIDIEYPLCCTQCKKTPEHSLLMIKGLCFENQEGGFKWLTQQNGSPLLICSVECFSEYVQEKSPEETKKWNNQRIA